MKYKRIIFMRPPGIGKLEIPLGILYVATAAVKAGYEVEIYDPHYDINEKEEVIESIKKNYGHVVLAVSALSPHYYWVKDFIDKIKNLFPDLPVLVGGHLVSAYKCLLANTRIDYLCNCEGEKFIDLFMRFLNNTASPEEIPGFIYFNKSKIVKNKRGDRITDYLIPDYSLIDMTKYLTHPEDDFFFRTSKEYQEVKNKNDLMSVIMFSRGCTGYCGFCYRHIPGYFQSDIDWCIEHIKLLYNTYGVRYFRIDDELFAESYEWVEAFFVRIKEENLDIWFRITGLRVDLATPEMLKFLKDNNCIAVNYGIESGSQKILDIMNKGTTVEQGLLALKNTRKLGMQAMAYIILGYVGETVSTLRQTQNFLLESGISSEYLSIFYTVALPGTKLYNDAMSQGLIKDEEKYLIDTSQIIGNSKSRQRERYSIPLCDLGLKVLQKYEYKIICALWVQDTFGPGMFVTLFKWLPYQVFGEEVKRVIIALLRRVKRYNLVFWK